MSQSIADHVARWQRAEVLIDEASPDGNWPILTTLVKIIALLGNAHMARWKAEVNLLGADALGKSIEASVASSHGDAMRHVSAFTCRSKTGGGRNRRS